MQRVAQSKRFSLLHHRNSIPPDKIVTLSVNHKLTRTGPHTSWNADAGNYAVRTLREYSSVPARLSFWLTLAFVYIMNVISTASDSPRRISQLARSDKIQLFSIKIDNERKNVIKVRGKCTNHVDSTSKEWIIVHLILSCSCHKILNNNLWVCDWIICKWKFCDMRMIKFTLSVSI